MCLSRISFQERTCFASAKGEPVFLMFHDVPLTPVQLLRKDGRGRNVEDWKQTT